MLEISFNRIKNCISELESAEKECERIRNELEIVYQNLDRLVDGKMDKRVLGTIIEEVSSEVKNIFDMKCVLGQVLHCYEKAEQDIILSLKGDKGTKDFDYVPLYPVGEKLEDMGIYFE